jgi:hypothetical protein
MSADRYPDWVAIAAGLGMVLLFGGNALLLVAESRMAKQRERITGRLESVETETVGGGVAIRPRTHAKVRYSYEYGGSRFNGNRASVLDIRPVVWAADEKDLVVRLQGILSNKLPLTIYVDRENPRDAVLVQYPLVPYLLRDTCLILIGMGLLLWIFLSGVTTVNAVFGVGIGVACYLFAVRRREDPI